MRILKNKNDSLVSYLIMRVARSVPAVIIVFIVRAWHGACCCESVPSGHSSFYSSSLAWELLALCGTKIVLDYSLAWHAPC
jgi:hypothetical protein